MKVRKSGPSQELQLNSEQSSSSTLLADLYEKSSLLAEERWLRPSAQPDWIIPAPLRPHNFSLGCQRRTNSLGWIGSRRCRRWTPARRFQTVLMDDMRQLNYSYGLKMKASCLYRRSAHVGSMPPECCFLSLLLLISLSSALKWKIFKTETCLSVSYIKALLRYSFFIYLCLSLRIYSFHIKL